MHRDVAGRPRRDDRATSPSRSPISGARARFYDAIFYALGARRMFESERRDRLRPRPRASSGSSTRGRTPAPGYGHVALPPPAARPSTARTRAGLEAGRPRRRASRPAAAVRTAYYAGYLLDPDGLRVELVAGAT